jgi:hypothetical protein
MRIRTFVAAALTAVSLAAVSLTAAPAASARESFVPWNWCGSHSTTDALRLRAAPSTDTGTVLGLLDPTDRLRTDPKITDPQAADPLGTGPQTDGWVRVTLWGRSGRGIPDRTTGWVAARYLAQQECTAFG